MGGPAPLKADPNDVGRPFDEEDLALLERLRPKGPARFMRYDPYATKTRRSPRGTSKNPETGGYFQPSWKDPVVFTDDSNTTVDPQATRYMRASAYLRRRSMPGGRASNFSKLSKAARILNRA